MKSLRIATLLIAAAMMAGVSTAGAATEGRIIPTNRVSLEKNGSVVANLTSQAPVDENALIICHGTCMVKLRGVSLVATDKTEFAVKQIGDFMNIYVKQGKINFIITDTSRQFAFYMPNGSYVKTEGFVVPASTDSAVKGYIDVTGKATAIGMERGGMVVQTTNGRQMISQGHAIQLAMAEVPAAAKTSGAAAALPSSTGVAGIFSHATLGMVIGGGAAVAWGAGLASTINNSGVKKPASPNR
ncbi:MAG: hypothetical protein GXP57_09595 [Deltaproteobacteria bacterium]|nr:hypothetical protein [Deltaproteobacteria bacterium]